jgi:glutamine amidotransferase
MITIIDYGVGNISAFIAVFKNLGIPIKRASVVSDLDESTKIILPGVGSFDHAMERLEASGMRYKLEEKVKDEKLPVIGICVGMQMLAKNSAEGKLPGLGWIDGEVKKLDDSKISFNTHLPHMGWNDVIAVKNSPIMSGLEKDARFYFLHSYYFECNRAEDVVAEVDYGGKFACIVNAGNVYGIQCHPEKSHEFGTQLLHNFAKL